MARLKNRLVLIGCLSLTSLLYMACENAPIAASKAIEVARPAPINMHDGPSGTALQANNLQPTEAVIGSNANASVSTPVSITSNYVAPPNLTGTWISENPEPAGNGRYWHREYVFTGNRWNATFTMTSDTGLKKTLFVLRANGMFNLQNPSKRIEGAYLIAFHNLEKFLKLEKMDKIMQKELGFETCNLQAGLEENISSSGCGIAMKVSECPYDYDLIRQEKGTSALKLVLGNRFTEMSSCSEDKRPVALGLPLIKKY